MAKTRPTASQSDDYLSGFANYLTSEAQEGALPKEQNSPQKLSYGLFAEQLSGAPFMSSRIDNRHSWLYKIRPSVCNAIWKTYMQPNLLGRSFTVNASPSQLHWLPFAIPEKEVDFIDGLFTIAGNGTHSSIRGSAVHIYRANTSMNNRIFCNNDGELLFVPESGAFNLFTEFGQIELCPGEICVIPPGIKFKIQLIDTKIRGYLLENFGPYLRLPELGPLGANGLASARHFLFPKAKYENYNRNTEVIVKFQDKLWSAAYKYSPLDVVAWQGNYLPCKYDLSLFQVVNSVSFDHTDPSIFTVLTSPSEMAGLPNVDFVIFPPRWSVAEHTFRQPYFHRNCMSEVMGVIFGEYDSRPRSVSPGDLTLHNRFSAHGPDADIYEKSINAELKPQKMENTLAIMFESSLVYQPTEQALKSANLDLSYTSCWDGFKATFQK